MSNKQLLELRTCGSNFLNWVCLFIEKCNLQYSSYFHTFWKMAILIFIPMFAHMFITFNFYFAFSFSGYVNFVSIVLAVKKLKNNTQQHSLSPSIFCKSSSRTLVSSHLSTKERWFKFNFLSLITRIINRFSFSLLFK